MSSQSTFFDRLARQFNKRGDMVSAMSRVLHVGRDAVYRRLRGETLLTTDELFLLSRHFKVRLQDRAEESPTFNYPGEQFYVDGELSYYVSFYKEVAKITAIPGVTIDYVTPEIPVYYELSKPTLLAFKAFMYEAMNWNLRGWEDKVFRPELINPGIYALAQRAARRLLNASGREIWSARTMNATLRQLEHAVKTGRLADAAIVDKIYTELSEIVDHMEAMARSGKRFPMGEEPTEDSPELQLYYNDLVNNNMIAIVNAPLRSFVFSSFVAPTYLVADDPRICEMTIAWYGNVIATGNRVSWQNGGQAIAFFMRLRYAVRTSLESINAIIRPGYQTPD